MDKDLIVSGFIQINDTIIPPDAIELLPSRSGSTCLCYMVRCQGRRYLLKRLRPELAGNPRYQEVFRKEYETGKRLSHPYLVEYVSMGEDVDGCYIVMEYIDGDTLGERMASDPTTFADPHRMCRLFVELLDCLGYLHQHQVLHLDLKPDNVLLTRISGDVKLIDLGYCYSDSYDRTMGRNDIYSAPEQQEGRISDINVTTDLYAVGLLLRDLCLLHPAVYGSEAVEAVIARSTQADPSLRYGSAHEMSEALQHALLDENPSANLSRRRGRKLLFALQALVILFLGVLIGHEFTHCSGRRGRQFADGNGLQYHILSADSLTCEVTGRDTLSAGGAPGSIYINCLVDGGDHYYRVVGLDDAAFRADSTIQVLIVSEGVQRLSAHAFSDCPKLQSVSLPLSLVALGEYCFSRCLGLRQVVLPPCLSRLANDAFNGCANLAEVSFPTELEAIGKECFASTGLVSLTLPEGLRALEDGAFHDCRRLRSVTLPASLERIGNYCFHYCDSLVEVRNLRPVPQPITNVFKDTLGLKRTLYVPSQSVPLYRKAPYWRNFARILPLP